jgi:NAD(P)-dependent dehydrogenase (short-subunit alcohol dehydrogenase family)
MGILDNKVAIITGSAMGMGASTAELFATEGAKVIIADFNEEKGRAEAEKIKNAGGEVSFYNVDVSKEDQVKALVDFTVKTYGALDVAINNAALTPDDKPIADFDLNYWNRLLAVDLTGVALCLKYEIRQMMAQGKGGSIVNVSSVNGIRPQPANPAYIAAKHGVIGLSRSAAMDYSPYGIRINIVAPGAVDTPMLRGALEQFGFNPDDYAKKLSMLGRFAQSEEVARAHLWLASDQSSYITGAIIAVDGGYTAM